MEELDFRSATRVADEPVPQSILDQLDALLPSGVDATVAQPQLFPEGFEPNPEVVSPDTDVWVTFVQEGASFGNSLGYFTYPTGSPPTSLTAEELEEGIIFANASEVGSGGTLYNGVRMHIGTFQPGVQIGFFLVADGHCTSGADCNPNVGVDFTQPIYTTVDAMNSEHGVDPDRSRHVVMADLLGDPASDARLLSWEDLNRLSGSDDDFEDVVFRVTATPELGMDGPVFEADVCASARTNDVCIRGPQGVRCVSESGPINGPGWSDAGGWVHSRHTNTVTLGDVNGDGFDDICGRSGDGYQCSLNDADGTGSMSTYFGGPGWSDAGGWGAARHYETIALADVNGDGNDDVCGRSGNNVQCYLSNGVDAFDQYFDGPVWRDVDGWSERRYYETIGFPDVDGDGNHDVCARGGNGIHCYLSNGVNGFDLGARFDGPGWSDAGGWGHARYYETIQFADVNGDGRDDVCGRSGANVQCSLSNGVDAFDTYFDGPAWSDANGWNQAQYYRTIQFGDINGDGADDLCGRDANGVQCYLSNGATAFDTFVLGPAWSDALGWSAETYGRTIQLVDVNDDSLVDVCGRAGTEGAICNLSEGTSFSSSTCHAGVFSDPAGYAALSNSRTMRFGHITEPAF